MNIQQMNDQSIINLARAIREQETGNQPIQGASGELKSRYQFLPNTWKGWAEEHLGNANASLTLENENTVAYKQIKKWKNQGYNPAQIASLWNSGKPEWKGNVGDYEMNGIKIHYDTPSYVRGVYEKYQKLKQETENQTQILQKKQVEEKQSLPIPTQQQAKDMSSFLGLIKETGKGMAEMIPKALGISNEPKWRVPLEEMQPAAFEGKTAGGRFLQGAKLGAGVMARPIYNLLVGAPAQTLKNMTAIPQEIKETYRAGKQAYSNGGAAGGVVGLGSAFLEAGKLLATPITWATKLFKGTMDEAMKSLTGYSIKDNASQKSVNQLVNAVKFTIDNPAEAGGRVAEAVLKITQENPETILMGANKVNALLSKYTGKNIDIIHQALSPLEKPFENIVYSLQTNSVDKLESDYDKWLGETQTGRKTIHQTEQREKILNQAGTEGKTGQRILAEDGIVPNTKQLKFDSYNQAQEYKDANKFLIEAEKQALEEVKYQVTKINIDDWRNATIDSTKAAPKTTVGIQADIIKQVNREFDLLSEKYPDGIDIAQLGAEKAKYWLPQKKFDFTQPFRGDADYQIATNAKQMIEEAAQEVGLDEIAQLNRLVGDKMEAAHILEILDGKSLKYGRLGKYFIAHIGSELGSTITGKVFGAVGGNILANILSDFSVSNPLKNMILNSIQTTNPEIYQSVMQWIGDQETIRNSRLLLPAGKEDAGQYQRPTIYGEEYKGTETPPYTDIQKENIVKYGNPEKPGGLYEFQQNIINSQKATGIFQPKSTIPIEKATELFVKNVVPQLEYRGQIEIANQIQNMSTDGLTTFNSLVNRVKDTVGQESFNTEAIQNWLGVKNTGIGNAKYIYNLFLKKSK